MANSSLLRTGEQDPVVTKGHGTGALGPSDSTDSGSDIQGGPGLNFEENLDLDRGTTSDADVDAYRTAGPDLGDADLDSDTDRYGTGERGAAGRDSSVPTDERTHEEQIGPTPEEQPHDFAVRRNDGRETLEPVDDAAEGDASSRLEEQEAPEGGEQPGLISGGIGGPSGTGQSGGKTGPGSGRNPGRR